MSRVTRALVAASDAEDGWALVHLLGSHAIRGYTAKEAELACNIVLNSATDYVHSRNMEAALMDCMLDAISFWTEEPVVLAAALGALANLCYCTKLQAGGSEIRIVSSVPPKWYSSRTRLAANLCAAVLNLCASNEDHAADFYNLGMGKRLVTLVDTYAAKDRNVAYYGYGALAFVVGVGADDRSNLAHALEAVYNTCTPWEQDADVVYHMLGATSQCLSPALVKRAWPRVKSALALFSPSRCDLATLGLQAAGKLYLISSPELCLRYSTVEMFSLQLTALSWGKRSCYVLECFVLAAQHALADFDRDVAGLDAWLQTPALEYTIGLAYFWVTRKDALVRSRRLALLNFYAFLAALFRKSPEHAMALVRRAAASEATRMTAMYLSNAALVTETSLQHALCVINFLSKSEVKTDDVVAELIQYGVLDALAVYMRQWSHVSIDADAQALVTSGHVFDFEVFRFVCIVCKDARAHLIFMSNELFIASLVEICQHMSTCCDEFAEQAFQMLALLFSKGNLFNRRLVECVAPVCAAMNKFARGAAELLACKSCEVIQGLVEYGSFEVLDALSTARAWECVNAMLNEWGAASWRTANAGCHALHGLITKHPAFLSVRPNAVATYEAVVFCADCQPKTSLLSAISEPATRGA